MRKALSTILNLQLPSLFQALPFSSQITEMKIPRTQKSAHIISIGPNIIIWQHLSGEEDGKFRLFIGSHGTSQSPGHLPASRKKKKKNMVGWLTVSTTVEELELEFKF